MPLSTLFLFDFCQIAASIRYLLDSYNKPVPAVLEIPSKDHPYDPNQDSLLARVKFMFGGES
jgi:V-type H+-transporting ATPase subunit F